MTLWFMTGNTGKVAEAAEHFSHHGIEVKQFEFDAVEPQADDLETVALAKLEQAIPHLPDPDDMLLVEDAGLFIGPLNGFPGVYSANALETIGNQGILRLLEHLQSEDPIMDSRIRDAEFMAVAVLYYKGQTIVAEGICPGRISHSEQGENGFGFDPIFIPCDLDESGIALERGEIGAISTHGKAFGAISLAEKQLYSHRRRALAGIIAALDSLE
jgi:XTP/dITP diphosphohydrolase